MDRRLADGKPDPRGERILAPYCADGYVDVCAELGDYYQELGNSELARRYRAKACRLGNTKACPP